MFVWWNYAGGKKAPRHDYLYSLIAIHIKMRSVTPHIR